MEVQRRYSEFASLRQTLVNLHPTLIIPPIPEKHQMSDYVAKPTRAKEDQQIIDLRKRMLAVFLNRCRRMREVLEDGVFWRFLDAHTSWVIHPSLTLYVRNDSLTRCAAERSPPSTPSLEHPQADPQGTPARHREPHASSQLPSRTVVFRKTQVRRLYIILRHSDCSSESRSTTFHSRPHHTRSADLRSFPTRD